MLAAHREGASMTKAELIERIARSRSLPPDTTKKDIEKIVTLAFEEIASYFARQNLTSATATPNQFIPPSALLLDLVARWQVTEKVTFTAGLYNLTNEKSWRYQDVRGLTTATTDIDRYTIPGINARFALNIRF